MPAAARLGELMGTVGLIGLGRVGAGYDTPEGAAVQTHLKACLAEPRLRLVAVADHDEARARQICQDWRLGIEPCSVDALVARRPDIVCIAAGTAAHLPLLERLAAAPPRLVLCEKPLGDDPRTARDTVRRLQQSGVVVAVAYPRRWLPPLPAWLAQARSGSFGRPLGAVAHYTKGLRNNASHALDLVHAFFGEGTADNLIVQDVINDGSRDDPTATMLFTLNLGTGRVPVWLHGFDARVQTIFDVELMFEGARVRIEDSDGVRARLDLPQPIGMGYAPELRPSESFHDHPPQLMALLWRNLADVLAGTDAPRCTAEDALATAALVDRVAAAARPAVGARASA